MKRILLYVLAGVVALLIILGVGIGAAYFVYSKMSAPATKPEEKKPEVQVVSQNVFVLKPFVANLADKNPPRYINVTFELVARSERETETLKGKLPLIRDAIVTVLNEKKSAEVTGESGTDILKDAVRERINETLGKPLVEKVLITDMVVQF